MNYRLVRGLLGLITALLTGTLLQGMCTTSDMAYGTFPRLVEDGALSGIDFCYIFDCQSGFFGGAWQPCSDNFDVFVDCPGFTGGTDGTTDTTQQTQ